MEDAENDAIIVKEKKLVDKFLIKSGMLRFSFLLECAPPGAIPDPQLVAAMLELVGFELVNMLIRTGVQYMYHINDFCFLTENDIINDIDRFLSLCFWLYM